METGHHDKLWSAVRITTLVNSGGEGKRNKSVRAGKAWKLEPRKYQGLNRHLNVPEKTAGRGNHSGGLVLVIREGEGKVTRLRGKDKVRAVLKGAAKRIYMD